MDVYLIHKLINFNKLWQGGEQTMKGKILKHKPYLKFKGALAERGLVQKDIAKLLSLSPVTINQKINGTLDFSFSEIEVICTHLDISSEIFRAIKEV